MKENYIKILISSNDLGKRVDIILSSKINDFSRNRIQSLILAGNVKLDDKIIKHQSLIIKDKISNVPKQFRKVNETIAFVNKSGNKILT